MASEPQSWFFRLGLGHLTDPFGEEARNVARLAFVAAVDQIAPEVAGDLAERLRFFLDPILEHWEPDQPSQDVQAFPPDPGELSNESYRQRESEDGGAPDAGDTRLLPEEPDQDDGPIAIVTSFPPAVNDAIVTWARRWNFGNSYDSWLVYGALTTVYIWMNQAIDSGGVDGQLHVGPYVAYQDRGSHSAEEARRLIDPTPHDRSFTLPGQEWNIRLETKADAYFRIMESLGRTVKEELARIEAEALSRGDLPVVVKPAAGDHLEWLIRYHVKGEGYAAIAREVGRSRQAVMLAVRQAADLIDLPLREPDRRGRPRKSTTPRIVKVHRKRSELHN